MKDLLRNSSENQASEEFSTRSVHVPPEVAGRALADLLHQSAKPKPEARKLFDLKPLFEKLAGKQSEVLDANEEHTISEVELDHHIEFRDQAIPLPTTHTQTPPQATDNDTDDESVYAAPPTPISTVLAEKKLETQPPPLVTQTDHQLPHQTAPEIDENKDMVLYKSYVKYGFMVAIVITILAVLITIF